MNLTLSCIHEFHGHNSSSIISKLSQLSCILETTARPCRANVGVSQCLTGAALRSIFVSCPSSLATYTHYFITSNNFVVLVMIPVEKRSVCVAYMRGRPARDAAIWYGAVALLFLWSYFVDYTFIVPYGGCALDHINIFQNVLQKYF